MKISSTICLACFGLLALACGPAFGEPLRWRSVIGSDPGSAQGESGFVAVEGQEADEGVSPARAFLAGKVELGGTFSFGGLPEIGSGDELGVVVRVSDQGEAGWSGDWQARVASPAGVELTDLAVTNKLGLVYVCGSFNQEANFENTAGEVVQTLTGGVDTGFIAAVDMETGEWTAAAVTTPGFLAKSIAVDRAGMVFLTGPGALLLKLTAAGELLWGVPAPAGTRRLVDVAVGAKRDAEHVYVLSEDDGAGSGQNVVLTQLDRETGAIGWTRRMGGGEDVQAGGIDVRKNGGFVAVAFSGRGEGLMIEGEAVVGEADVDGRHAALARLRPTGKVAWALALGNPSEGGSLEPTAVSVDAKGNIWVCGSADGWWEFLGEDKDYYSDDAVLVAADPKGVFFQAQRSSGWGDSIPVGIWGTTEQAMIVGVYGGGSVYFERAPNGLASLNHDAAFFAMLEIPEDQRLMVIRANPENLNDFELMWVEWMLAMWGHSSYATVENGPLGTAVSSWLMPDEVAELENNPSLIVEPELVMEPNGTVTDAGWALARLGDFTAAAPWTYTYPETANEVVLYLIDTAVANPDGWFDGNPNLTIEESILIRGTGDPEESSEFGHGTRMLSLVAGPETGAAQGTPIRVVSYDIYPDGTTTTATLVAKAVLAAAQRHQQEPWGTRGVICLATSSQSKGTSMTLELAVDYAVAAGLPVVVSAGNSGEDASSFIPAGYGVEDGVICVGAVDSGHQRTAISNFGSAVDLYAPGEKVNVVRFDAPASGVYDLSSGTSPATALTAAAALVELSQETTWRAEEVEKLLYENSQLLVALTPQGKETIRVAQMGPYGVVVINPGGGGTVVKTEFERWAETAGLSDGTTTLDPAADSDGDGTVDLLEFVQGSDPLEKEEPVRTITYQSDSDEISYEFEITPDLFDAKNPTTLLDGTGWEIQCSGDMVNWATVNAELTFDSTAEGRVLVKVAVLPETAQCFLRIVLTPVVVKTVVATPVVLTPVDQ